MRHVSKRLTKCAPFNSAGLVLLGMKTASPPERPRPKLIVAAAAGELAVRSILASPCGLSSPSTISYITTYVYFVLRPAQEVKVNEFRW